MPHIPKLPSFLLLQVHTYSGSEIESSGFAFTVMYLLFYNHVCICVNMIVISICHCPHLCKSQQYLKFIPLASTDCTTGPVAVVCLEIINEAGFFWQPCINKRIHVPMKFCSVCFT